MMGSFLLRCDKTFRVDAGELRITQLFGFGQMSSPTHRFFSRKESVPNLNYIFFRGSEHCDGEY